jgi:hypothetical protein
MARLCYLLVATLIALPVSLGVAATASAATAHLTCAYEGTATFTPGVTPTPRDIALGGTLKAGSQLSAATPCTSQTGVPYTGATVTISGEATDLACTTTGLSGSASGTMAITGLVGEIRGRAGFRRRQARPAGDDGGCRPRPGLLSAGE